MTVISGIIEAVKIGIRVAPVIYKSGKIVYKAGGKTRQGAQWLSRHPKIVKYGTVAAGASSLLLDLTNIDYSAIIPEKVRPPTVKQTRSNFQSSRSRFRRESNCYPGYRYRRR